MFSANGGEGSARLELTATSDHFITPSLEDAEKNQRGEGDNIQHCDITPLAIDMELEQPPESSTQSQQQTFTVHVSEPLTEMNPISSSDFLRALLNPQDIKVLSNYSIEQYPVLDSPIDSVGDAAMSRIDGISDSGDTSSEVPQQFADLPPSKKTRLLDFVHQIPKL